MISRRTLLGSSAGFTALSAFGASFAATGPATGPATGKAPPVSRTDLNWLDGRASAQFGGATLGVPWPRGTVKPKTQFRLTNAEGEVPVQSWPLAYWPDGTLKWTAHAVPPGVSGDTFSLSPGPLSPGKPAAPKAPVSVKDSAEGITVATGEFTWAVARSGEALITRATRTGRDALRDLKLVALTLDQPDPDATGSLTQTRFTSKISKVTIEQTGPVRAVLKVEGAHSDGSKDWLPFSVRLYFHAGSDQVRIVHSFIYDGDPAKAFIRGLGVTARVPMTDDLHNRHIRLSGEGVGDEPGGVFGEAVRTLTAQRRDPGQAYREAQVAGALTGPVEGMSAAVQKGLKWIPPWGDYTLAQLSPDGFTIKKRTRAGHGWIESNAGTRTRGLAYIGGAAGGVALGFKDFWQRCPSQLDIRNAHTEMAEITAWMWAPDAAPMDIRPYRSADGMDTTQEENEGLDITYEDYQAGWDTPLGVARTTELSLWTLGGTPSHQAFADMAETVANPPRLVLTPQRLHQAGVFGDWSPADRSTPARVLIETKLDYDLAYYMTSVEQHKWYGFWSYGDVMHSYDPDRHMWRYDNGGMAWANSELSPDLWLWYSYLRTGRADVFKFAEAMTRHTGEVDVYHLGPYKGFGTRHGVQHWSDSSKQPRVSTAAYRRIYYFLTADERVGDLMRDLIGSEWTLENVDIGRKLPGAEQKAVRPGVVETGFGTTWCSFLAMWLAEWERTNDPKWRDHILAGMDSIGGLTHGWFNGGAPFDLKTGRFLGEGGRISVSHLNAVFGAVEVNSELLALLDAPKYRAAWLEYCRYYNAPAEIIKAHLGESPRGRSLRMPHSRLTAYAAHHEQDQALAIRAWEEFFLREGQTRRPEADLTPEVKIIKRPQTIRDLAEDASLGTNGVSQYGLAAIQNLALIGDQVDAAAKQAGVM